MSPIQEIKFSCGICGSNYSLPEKYAGQTAKCKRCGELLRVPAPVMPEIIEPKAKLDYSKAAKVVLFCTSVVLFALCGLGALLSPGEDRANSDAIVSKTRDKDGGSEMPVQQVKKTDVANSGPNDSKRTVRQKANGKSVIDTTVVRVALWEHFDMKFPYGYKTHFLGQKITHEGNNRFICSGKVDVTNAFNAKRTYLYAVEIKMFNESQYKVTASLIE